jgi:predicted nucleotide-binding protein
MMIEKGFGAHRMPTSTSHGSQTVFIVHGHEEATKQSVARFLERLGLTVTILHEMPSGGRTIVEKFESYSAAAAAVVLLTADDIGAAAGHHEGLRPRARQNVIFELGYFCGALGRARTIALHGDVELPSDYAGVVYIPIDAAGAWRFDLVRELRAAGLTVDANALFV